jgi:hypothetical protein
MERNEAFGVRIRRISGIIEITILDLLFFLVLLYLHFYLSINLVIFTESFLEVIGVLLGLTFTSYAILLGIGKSIDYTVRSTKAFGVLGYILLLNTLIEIITLGTGLFILTKRGISTELITISGSLFVFLSTVIISYLMLIIYYMTMIFNLVREEK